LGQLVGGGGIRAHDVALDDAQGCVDAHDGFLFWFPFALSWSKGFDRLSPNGR
jgi:hypothetical protein